MAKRNRLVLQETYRPGTTIGNRAQVVEDVKNATRIELKEKGKYEDGTEFITIKVMIK